MLFFPENVPENQKKHGQPHTHQEKNHGCDKFNCMHKGLFKV